MSLKYDKRKCKIYYETHKTNSDKCKCGCGGRPKWGEYCRGHSTRNPSVEHRKNMSISAKKRIKKYGIPFKGKHHSNKAKKEMSLAHLGMPVDFSSRRSYRGKKNPNYRGGGIKKLRCNMCGIKFNRYILPCYNLSKVFCSQLCTAKYALQCAARGKTIPEKVFIKYCRFYNLPFKYVGNGKFWISNMNPDFIQKRKGAKKCIEIFGEYFHSTEMNPKVKYKHTEKGRIEGFAKYGWKCLVIWADTLLNKAPIEIELQIIKEFGEEWFNMSSIAKTITYLRANNYMAENVEKFNSYTKHKKDVFSIIDSIAIKNGVSGVTGIQSCGRFDIKTHFEKVLENEKYIRTWLQAGNHFFFHGWDNIHRGKTRLKIVQVLLNDDSTILTKEVLDIELVTSELKKGNIVIVEREK